MAEERDPSQAIDPERKAFVKEFEDDDPPEIVTDATAKGEDLPAKPLPGGIVNI